MISTDVNELFFYLAFGTLFTFFGIIFVYWFTWYYRKRFKGLSPYSGMPLRMATEISFDYARKVVLYLRGYHMYDNRPFKFRKATFCRETGRIFPNTVNTFNIIHIDWSFLQKRYPGTYVSWGSLNDEQKIAVRDVHKSLDDFQTELSSPEPSPRAIKPEYAFTQPGPLYVDIETKVLLGWKVVPETELEVLIVQKPIK